VFDPLVKPIADSCVQLAHYLLVDLVVELAVFDLDDQLRIPACYSPLDACFDLEVEPLYLLAHEDKLVKLAIELALARHVVIGALLFYHALAHFQDSLLDC
jgi:hypothetical protein